MTRTPVSARFASASEGCGPAARSRSYGIEVGKVERLAIDPKRQMALVEMKISSGIKVFDDATATIKTSGLIGDKYIKIEPGGAGEPLKPGGTITDTTAPADLEELIGKYAFGDVKQSPPKAGK